MKIKHQNKKPSLIDIGWREWICLSEFNDFHLKAKIDTGATISAIHATHIEEYIHKGCRYVKFRIYQSKNYKMIETTEFHWICINLVKLINSIPLIT